MFQLYLVAGTYAFQCCHLCIRRGAQNDPETASWRLGGTGDVLLVARCLHHIVALIHYHLYNTADILLSYFIRHSLPSGRVGLFLAIKVNRHDSALCGLNDTIERSSGVRFSSIQWEYFGSDMVLGSV